MIRKLTLRTRLVLLTAVAVGLVAAGVAVAGWIAVEHRLNTQVDRTIMQNRLPPNMALSIAENQSCVIPPAGDGQQHGDGPPPVPFLVNFEFVFDNGTSCTFQGADKVTVTDADRQVASGKATSVWRDGVTTSGERIRIHTTPVVLGPDHTVLPGAAMMAWQPLGETDKSLHDLALILLIVAACGVAAAAAAGLLVAHAALRPVDRLTDAAEHIARTDDLGTQISIAGGDEIARLGRSFNSMTSALAASREQQQQLIADAGHELRTPLTSLGTNIDLLLLSEETGRPLSKETRESTLRNVKAQLRELGVLVDDLVDLSRPEYTSQNAPDQQVALHDVAARAVERAQLRDTGVEIDAHLEPWWLTGDPAALERAIVNLLDNAVKFSPAGTIIEVRLAKGALTVRDHGPGIAEEDLPHVFDRFWRSASARAMPGSGLGLAIVARTAREHGGSVALSAPDQGDGTVATLRLPGEPNAF